MTCHYKIPRKTFGTTMKVNSIFQYRYISLSPSGSFYLNFSSSCQIDFNPVLLNFISLVLSSILVSYFLSAIRSTFYLSFGNPFP
jgi:hypothetical protein